MERAARMVVDRGGGVGKPARRIRTGPAVAFTYVPGRVFGGSELRGPGFPL